MFGTLNEGHYREIINEHFVGDYMINQLFYWIILPNNLTPIISQFLRFLILPPHYLKIVSSASEKIHLK